ncbi:hypothetical protein ACJJTC_013478 [Scirpophaga incertulas]
MKGAVVFDGKLSEPFVVSRGVRQGCVLAPTLFGIYFSLILHTAFGDNQQGIHLHTRADGKLFNISLLKSKRNREDLFVDSLLYADDAAFVAVSECELQDCAKRDMAAFNIDYQNWQRLAEGRADWRRSVMEGCIKCDKAWFATLADKREKKLQSDTEPTAQRFSCQTCGRPCRSRIGLFSHEKGCLHKITP